MQGSGSGLSDAWVKAIALFERLAESDEPDAILAAEPDPEVARTAQNLFRSHQQATDTEFMEEPLMLIGNAFPQETARFAHGDRLVERFTVDRMLGSGGMGEVYLAHDDRLHEKIAIKTIRGPLALDPAIRKRFLSEVRNAHRVTHPNVCRIFDLVDDGDSTFFSMQYLEGISLSDALREHNLSTDVRRRIALQLAEGLDAAHRNGIIHCDFKPANVLLTGDLANPHPVITDFGLARALGDGHAVNAHSLQAGTLNYMAPELRQGGSASVRTDIYAFGKVLSDLQPANKLVARCTAENPADRPETLRTVINGLRGVARRRIWLMAAAAVPFATLAGYEILTRPRIPLLARQRIAFNGFRPAATPQAVLVRDLVITAVSQSLHVSVTPDERLRSILAKANLPPSLPADRASLLAAAAREGIALVIEGILAETKGRLKLLLQVFEPGSRTPLLSMTQQADDPRQVVSLAERAALQLRREFGESQATVNASHTPLEQVTSASPDAVEFYFRGVRLYDNAEAEAAIEWFQQAISIDPQFALAHTFLALALIARYKLFTALPSFETAFALRHRVSPRERGWIEYQYFNFIRDNASSLESARRLATLYPDDSTYQRNVAFAYAFLGRPEDSLPFSRRAVELDPNTNNMSELIVNYAEANLCDEALANWRDFRARGNNSTLLDRGAGNAWMGKGQMNEAAEAFVRMGSDAKRDRWARLLRCAPEILRGRFTETARTLESDLAWDRATHEESHTLTRLAWLGYLRWLMDEPHKARGCAEQLIAMDAQPATLDETRDASLIALAIGETDLARAGLDKLRQIERRWPSTRTQGIRTHIEGALLGSTDEAGALLYQAVGLWPDSPATYSQIRWLAHRNDSAAIAACEVLDRQRGRILRRWFPGLVVLGWIEQARFDESLRLYERVGKYWAAGTERCTLLLQVRTEADALNKGKGETK
jgi:serine/threonine protein kinase